MLPTATDLEPRRELLATAQALNASGLNQGTSGNASLRIEGGLLVTPTSLPYAQMGPHDLVALDLQGRPLVEGQRRPSSEWRLHADILRRRSEVHAVVHCHSTSATALACHGRGIPPFHYMVVVAGGADVRCAPYALFGTQDFSDLALQALQDRQAALLAHHGQVALGASLAQALALAIEIETLARMYLQACTLGEPPELSGAAIAQVAEQMQRRHYGIAASGPG
ncbi:MAG: class II aldolase [Cyanobacteria bacterium M_surface_7_m2_040]|nr:class II aldolase [Cyanobacteria bacterium K_Offshore_0m_m2_072]MBM5827612.1 class II aldolase [Cyanobacteria bacterium M_surface_7_m2_040]